MGSELGGPPPRYDRPIFEPPPQSGGGLPRAPGPGRATAAGRPGFRLSSQARLGILVLLLVAALAGAGYAFALRQNPPYVLDSYEVVTVIRRDFRRLIQVEGQVRPERVYTLAAPAEATVDAVLAAPGDDVEAGAVLVRLRSPSLLKELDDARASLAKARYSLEETRLTTAQAVEDARRALDEARRGQQEAEAALPQKQKLYDLGGISRAELDQAKAALDQAQARRRDAEASLELAQQKQRLALGQAQQQLEAAQSAVARLEEQAARLTVRAPVAGRVLTVSVHAGDEVGPGKEVVRLADVSRLHVEANVPSLQAAQLARGQSATVIGDGSVYRSEVDFVAPEATTQGDASVVAVRLKLLEPAPLRPFAPVAVEIVTGVVNDQPAVERGPFYTSGDGAFVYVVSDDGRRAVRRRVRYGLMDGAFIQVLEGLEPGERIVFSSYLGFRDRPEILLAPGGGRLR